jgi:hypothetical protein
MPTNVVATQADIDYVKRLLPTDGSPAENGWDDAHIALVWTGYVSTTVRAYWFQRVSDTAGYIDLPDPAGALTITQQYRQAREMLDYWDMMIEKWGAATDPANYGSRPTRVGKIKRRYENKYPYAVSPYPISNGPYNPAS